jgi:hypothetical protein
MSAVSTLDDYLQSLRESVGDRPAVEVLASLTEVLSDGAVVLRDGRGDPVAAHRWHDLVAPPAHCRSAALLGIVHEALLGAAERKARGAHYTPPPVAHDLVAFVRRAAPVRDGGRWCDPAVGGGAFLLAAAASMERCEGVARADAARRVWGADIDPLAVWVARAALEVWAGEPLPELRGQLVVGDVLDVDGALWPSGGPPFDVIVGNPPFQSPLHRRNASADRRRAARRGPAQGVAAPYADAASRFLLAGLDLVPASGGVVALIQPQSTLSARDAAAARGEVARRGGLAGLWFARDAVFRAAVRVCAPVAVTGHRPPRVERATDAAVAPEASIDQPPIDAPWSTLVVDLLGVPPLPPRRGPSLRDLGVTATAGFRDEFYGLAAAAREALDRAGDDGDDADGGGRASGRLRVVTVGAIDVLGHSWGRRPIRLGGRRFLRPVVRPADAPPRVATWLEARRGPKLLVATQTAVLEVVVDVDGDLVGCTPVLEVRPPSALCWHVAAALSGPVASGWALAAGAGSARSVRALKLSASQLLDLPLPPLGDPHWAEAAERAEGIARARAGGQHVAIEQWSAFADAACRAYGADPERWVPWWLGRQNALTPQAAPC